LSGDLYSTPIGQILKTGVVLLLAKRVWRIYQRPKAEGKLVFWLWLTAHGFVFSFLALLFSPDSFKIHLAHLQFILGLGLLTLLIASRIILAHGDYPLTLETHSKVYRTLSWVLLLSALTRLSAPLTSSYAHHLGYAALTWLFGLGIWGVNFIPKTIKHNNIK
jgi:hypothetical protein